MDNLSQLIASTHYRALQQRRVNTLGFFLPLGVALFFLADVLLYSFSLPVVFALILPLIVLCFMLNSLGRDKKTVRREIIAALLDEKTDGKERFLTLVTLPPSSPSEHPNASASFLTQLRREAARKAALFVPKRDLPFQLDRRVPVAFLGAVLSGILLFFLPVGDAASVSQSAPTPDALIQNIEDIARNLLRPQSTPETQKTGAQLLVLTQELKDPALTPQQQIRLIDEAQKRMNLPVSIPQILPIDLKLFGSDSQQGDDPGNQGDTPQPENQPLAKTNENLEQLKKALSAAQGNEPQQGAQNQDQQNQEQQDQSNKQGQQNKKPQPKESGGGIKFDQPQQKTGQKQSEQNSSDQQQQSAQQPDKQHSPSGADPRKAGQESQRQAAQNASAGHQPQQPNPSGQQPKNKIGKASGQGKGERFYKKGEQPGGFLTKDARFVKVRIPTDLETDAGSKQRTENTSPAVPTTPYSNAPLAERPEEKNASQQPIPLEYRAILQ